MESYYVNFDYEYELYQCPVPGWMNKVLKPSLECLYFYCNETLPLASNIQYEDEFLEKLQAKTIAIQNSSLPWWGDLNPLSKLSNCKLENHRLNKEMGLWTPQGGVISSFSDLQNIMKHGRWRLKDPWMMGGTGQWRISLEMLDDEALRRGIENRLKKGELLLEESLDIKKVIGTTFSLCHDKVEKLFSVENYLNSQGNFQGGMIIETPLEISDELLQMAEYWKDRGATGLLEIDSFELMNNLYYPCVEVNHRKTMGWFIWNLSKKFGHGKMLLNSQEGIQLNPLNSPMKVSWVRI